MMRKIGLGLRGIGILVFGLGLSPITGCGNTRTIAAGNRERFRSCYTIGFSGQDVAAIYDSAVIDRANGFSYYEESRAAANACVDSCYNATVCSNGCTSCTYEIIDAVYLKSPEKLATKSSASEDLAISVVIKGLLPTNR